MERRFLDAVYRGALGREPDKGGLNNWLDAIAAGMPWDDVIRHVINSDEFKNRAINIALPKHELPDLQSIFSDNYEHTNSVNGDSRLLYHAREDSDIRKMEEAIFSYGYYDLPGVWGREIDEDKRTTASIVRALGARSCLDIGCFSGPVISLLDKTGIDVVGIEVSHLAFLTAFPNIKSKMLYGDLLGVRIDRRFDVVICLDILEHVSPLKVGTYLNRIRELLNDDGYLYVNSPMFGSDDVFGEVFALEFEQWRAESDGGLFRHMDCDDRGWPMHGHLIWATPKWWEKLFLCHGFVRNRSIERAVQSTLADFFARAAPARKSLFVLRKQNSSVDAIKASTFSEAFAHSMREMAKF